MCDFLPEYRQAAQEPLQEVPRYRQDQGPQEVQELSAPSTCRILMDMDRMGRIVGCGQGLVLKLLMITLWW